MTQVYNFLYGFPEDPYTEDFILFCLILQIVVGFVIQVVTPSQNVSKFLFFIWLMQK